MRQRFVLALAIAVSLGACGSQPPRTEHVRTSSRTARAEEPSLTPQEESERLAREEAARRRREHAAATRDEGLPTAMDQSEEVDDLEITRQIRAAVIGDSSLSLEARNVTIVTRDAVVTLRGGVQSNAEREAIVRHARHTAGVQRVENLLSVEAEAP